jgi:hypothetical protein
MYEIYVLYALCSIVIVNTGKTSGDVFNEPQYDKNHYENEYTTNAYDCIWVSSAQGNDPNRK